MSPTFPEPTRPAASRAAVLVGYLDFFRETVLTKVAGRDEVWLRSSAVPSGWSPLELVRHLSYVERRWLVWGFEGRPVADPWGDEADGRWAIPAGLTVEEVLAELRDQGEVTRSVVGRHDLAETGRPGPRWDGQPPAALERVLLHLVQEYARHVGHLDVVRELADGQVGEAG